MEGLDNRTNILTCALKLFATKGYDAVGVQDIVEMAGVTKPTLYHYFGNKYGLLETVLGEYFNQLHRLVEENATYKGDLPLTLERLITAFFEFAEQNPLFYRLQLSIWFAPVDSEPYKVVAGLNERIYELIENLFKEAANNHGNMRGRHQAYAATFLGMVNNYVALSLNNYTQLNQALVQQAAHQFMYGIFS
jgi:AcrR family transcriptional regulator